MKYDYWYWKNYLSSTQIIKINQFINKLPITNEPISFAATGSNKRKKKFLKTSLVEWKLLNPFFPNLWEMIVQANLENFGYDITYLNNDIFHYNFYSSKTKDRYDWHIDTSTNNRTDLKFTIIINISDKIYQGGKFKLFSNTEYEVSELNTAGSMIMFKSHINHKVEPVTKGERKTLSLFIKGPAFK